MTLSPTNAARIADAAYALNRTDVVAASRALAGAEGDTSFLETWEPLGDLIQGNAGYGITGSRTGFATVMQGKGPRQGEYCVAIRGTANIIPDGITDAHASLTSGPRGLPVHRGFNTTYNSFKGEMMGHFRGRNPSVIHVVGHSLGGALANLAAMDLAGGVAGVKLYTFGSPRVGMKPFSDALNDRIGASNIRRVYADTDPVPMVPIFPFLHGPRFPGGYRFDGQGAVISFGAHSMTNSYGRAMQNQSWNGLAQNIPAPMMDTVDALLQQAARFSSVPFSSAAFSLLGYALRGIMAAAEVVLGTVVLGALTTIDMVAYMLTQAIRISEEVGMMVRGFINGVLRFLGMTIQAGQSATSTMLRWVLDRLFASIGRLATMALRRHS